jgi:hypothetical protein
LLTMVAMQPAERAICPPLLGCISMLWIGMPTGMSCGGWVCVCVGGGGGAQLHECVMVCRPAIVASCLHTPPGHAHRPISLPGCAPRCPHLEWQCVAGPDGCSRPRRHGVARREALRCQDVAVHGLLARLGCSRCARGVPGGTAGTVHAAVGERGARVARTFCQLRHRRPRQQRTTAADSTQLRVVPSNLQNSVRRSSQRVS